MSKTLQQILGARNLVGVIQGVKGGVPEGLLPPAFLTPTRRVRGDNCTYHRVTGTRKTARQVHYGSPSVRRSIQGISEIPVKLMHSAEHVFHSPTTLMNLKEIGNEALQNLGRSEISRQTGEFGRLYNNLRLASVYSIFRDGHIYFDGDGNLLNSSSGAAVDIDMGIGANNLNQLNSIIAADWDTAGTDIHLHIIALKEAARKSTGYPITTAFYGASCLDYFLGNTKLSAIINRNAGFQNAFASGEIPNGFLGLNWYPLYEAFFEDNDGTNQDFVTAAKVIFTPDPSPEWWEVVEGSYPVPTDIGNVAADGTAAVGNVMEVNGKFSYALVQADPVSIKHIAGDTFLPLLKVPDAMYIATVSGF